MFNSSDRPGAASDALPYCDHARPTFPPPDLTLGSGIVAGVDVCSLPAGTEVVVDTWHSRYRFVMLTVIRRQTNHHFTRSLDQRAEGES